MAKKWSRRFNGFTGQKATAAQVKMNDNRHDQRRSCLLFFDEKTVVFVWLCHGVGVDLLNGFTDTHPEGQIGEDLHYAALVRKRRLLQHRKVFHQTVVDDIEYVMDQGKSAI